MVDPPKPSSSLGSERTSMRHRRRVAHRLTGEAMYDFPLTTEGYQDMARGIGKHAWNVHVKAQAHEASETMRRTW